MLYSQKKMSGSHRKRIWSPQYTVHVYWGCMFWEDLLFLSRGEGTSKSVARSHLHIRMNIDIQFWSYPFICKWLCLISIWRENSDIRFSRIKTGEWWYIYVCTTVILYGFSTHQLPIKSIHLIISIYQYCMFTKIIHYRYILINNVF